MRLKIEPQMPGSKGLDINLAKTEILAMVVYGVVIAFIVIACGAAGLKFGEIWYDFLGAPLWVVETFGYIGSAFGGFLVLLLQKREEKPGEDETEIKKNE